MYNFALVCKPDFYEIVLIIIYFVLLIVLDNRTPETVSFYPLQQTMKGSHYCHFTKIDLNILTFFYNKNKFL